MADLLTPHLGFPYPNPADPLGGVAATVQAGMLAVEDQFRDTFDNNAATSSLDDTTMPTTAGTYEASGSRRCAFVAPPNLSGRVHIYVSALLEVVLTGTASRRELWYSASIWEGPTSTPGAEVDTPNDFDSVMVGVGGNSGDMVVTKASFWWVSATLTPGQTYHILPYKKVSHTTTCTIRIDQVSVRVFTK